MRTLSFFLVVMAFLLAAGVPAALPTLRAAAGGSQVLLPVVARPVTLTRLAAAQVPTDIIDTPHGILFSEAESYVYNLSQGTLFLDLSGRAEIARLQGIAYRDGFLYAGYLEFGKSNTQYLSRFPVRDGRADPQQEQILFSTPVNPLGLHFAGDLTFGPDGYLYYALGDGGGNGNNDPARTSQDRSTLFGSILRLDVVGGGGPPDCDPDAGYTVPADNPFADGPGGACDEIWVMGLRQPWRIAFDARGALWIGDVGRDWREEIDQVPAGSTGGENFGWNCYEGTRPFDMPWLPFDPQACAGPFVPPLHEYSHETHPARCAITGGHIYRGQAIPMLVGRYVFADYCSGEILYLDEQGREQLLIQQPGAGWTTFGERADGELLLGDSVGNTIYLLGQ